MHLRAVAIAGPNQTTGSLADMSLFVGDLAPDVTEEYLFSFFKNYFPSVKGAKVGARTVSYICQYFGTTSQTFVPFSLQVISDPATGRSKGYGFVRFGSEAERDRALADMNGVYISTRPIRVSIATAKKPMEREGVPPVRSTPASSTGGASATSTGTPVHPDADPNNTTLFIGGLHASITEEQLRFTFLRFGEIVYTKIPQGKGCGFVQFVDRKAAEYAMQEMQGYILGGQAIRISWGRSSARGPVNREGPHAPPPYGYPYPYPYDHAGYGAYGMYPADPYYAAYPGMDPYAVSLHVAWIHWPALHAQLCVNLYSTSNQSYVTVAISDSFNSPTPLHAALLLSLATS